MSVTTTNKALEYIADHDGLDACLRVYEDSDGSLGNRLDTDGIETVGALLDSATHRVSLFISFIDNDHEIMVLFKDLSPLNSDEVQVGAFLLPPDATSDNTSATERIMLFTPRSTTLHALSETLLSALLHIPVSAFCIEVA